MARYLARRQTLTRGKISLFARQPSRRNKPPSGKQVQFQLDGGRPLPDAAYQRRRPKACKQCPPPTRTRKSRDKAAGEQRVGTQQAHPPVPVRVAIAFFFIQALSLSGSLAVLISIQYHTSRLPLAGASSLLYNHVVFFCWARAACRRRQASSLCCTLSSSKNIFEHMVDWLRPNRFVRLQLDPSG